VPKVESSFEATQNGGLKMLPSAKSDICVHKSIFSHFFFNNLLTNGQA
jgi:hypothetical protein